MPIEVIVIVCFLGAIFGIYALTMLLGDLFFGGRKPIPVRRTLTVADEKPSNQLGGWLGQQFDYLVLESGFEWSSMTAMLVMLTTGTALGSIVYIAVGRPLAALWTGIVGMVLPLLVLMLARSRRMREISIAIPEVVDLLARSIHAGESIEQAVALVGSELKGPLAQEFQHVSRQLELGIPIASAMQSLAGRIRIMELRILATTLSIHRRSGGSLASTLDRMSDVIRDRINFRRQVRAMTGASRFSAMLIASVGPILFVTMLFIQPEHMSAFLKPGFTQSLFICACLLELIGIIWVLRLMQYEN